MRIRTWNGMGVRVGSEAGVQVGEGLGGRAELGARMSEGVGTGI